MDAGRVINQISIRLKRRSFRVGRMLGITGIQGQVLEFILVESRERSLYQKDIEKEFDLRPSTATELLKNLEEQGMIRRAASAEDGRLKEICFTETAKKVQKAIQDEIQKTEMLLKSGIGEEELEIFLRVAEKMKRNLGD